jgi:hypothetical protein
MYEHEPIEEVYFKWLCAKVEKLNGPPTPSLTHWKLFRILHTTEFVWFIPNDDNRIMDGLELRIYFLSESRCQDDKDWMAAGCSVLEMLIAFANRAEFMTDEPALEWFWRFIENLNLTRFTENISNVLERFVWRTYQPSGVGGLFPIRSPRRDQRLVEIWYQFCDYLSDE